MNIVIFHRLSHGLLSLQENIGAFTIFNLNLAQENKNHFLKKITTLDVFKKIKQGG